MVLGGDGRNLGTHNYELNLKSRPRLKSPGLDPCGTPDSAVRQGELTSRIQQMPSDFPPYSSIFF